MKLTYDPRYNIAYITLRDKTEQVETIEVSSEMNIDLAPDGTIYGIELLNANQQLGNADQSNLIVVNEALGESSEIKLSLNQT
ncbi:DUF2283 domain-containing protein [Phormidesmis priestleyi]